MLGPWNNGTRQRRLKITDSDCTKTYEWAVAEQDVVQEIKYNSLPTNAEK